MPFGLWKKKAQATVDRQRQVDLGYAARLLEQGDMSLVAGMDPESFSLPLEGVSLLEPKVAQATLGGIKGRIARGIYFYVAQPQSPEPVSEMIEADRGTMTIGAGGISFAGKTRHIGIGFAAIESIGHNDAGITVIAKNQKLHFGAGAAFVSLKIHDREYGLPLSGRMLRLLVEAMIKRSQA